MKLFRLSSLLCGAMLLLSTACSKDEPTPLTLDALATEGAPATNTLRSLEEAQAEALQIFSALQPTLRTHYYRFNLEMITSIQPR